jgi:hypothetical protein
MLRVFNKKEHYRLKCGIFRHVIRVPVDAITDIESLAYVVRRHHGFGTFNVLFYSAYLKNRFYKPKTFRCYKQYCGYYKKGRCKTRWKKHELGGRCLKNKPYAPNWKTKIQLIISPMNTGDDEYDFEAKVSPKKANTMHTFWFWEKKKKKKD